MRIFYSRQLGSFTSEKEDLSDLGGPYLEHARKELFGRLQIFKSELLNRSAKQLTEPQGQVALDFYRRNSFIKHIWDAAVREQETGELDRWENEGGAFDE